MGSDYSMGSDYPQYRKYKQNSVQNLNSSVLMTPWLVLQYSLTSFFWNTGYWLFFYFFILNFLWIKFITDYIEKPNRR